VDEQEMRDRFEKALALAGDVHSFQDILDDLKSGAKQAFWSDRAFVVTEIGVFPRKKILNLVYLAGEMDDVLALQPQIEAFGKEHGCSFMTAVGRPGWLRVLPQRGWRHTASVFMWPLGG
jgi:hypothetical protein